MPRGPVRSQRIPFLHDAWEGLQAALCTTRKRQSEDKNVDWRRRKDTADEEAGRRRTAPTTRRQTVPASEAATMVATVPATTIFDFL